MPLPQREFSQESKLSFMPEAHLDDSVLGFLPLPPHRLLFIFFLLLLFFLHMVLSQQVQHAVGEEVYDLPLPAVAKFLRLLLRPLQADHHIAKGDRLILL